MEDKITIKLEKKHRDLILDYQSYFKDTDIYRIISIAAKKENHYEIYIDDIEELESLIDSIYELYLEEEDEEKENQLDELHDYLFSISESFDNEDEEEDFSKYSSNTGSVVIFKVFLAGQEKIYRKIAIRQGQTLHDLHNIIFEAFDRDDEHLYSYYFPLVGMKNFEPRKIIKNSIEYAHPYAFEEEVINLENKKDATKATIESLELEEGETFYYLFDFGDEWWHEIIVEKKDEPAEKGKYPKIIQRKGKSPAQYDYPFEEDDEED